VDITTHQMYEEPLSGYHSSVAAQCHVFWDMTLCRCVASCACRAQDPLLWLYNTWWWRHHVLYIYKPICCTTVFHLFGNASTCFDRSCWPSSGRL